MTEYNAAARQILEKALKYYYKSIRNTRWSPEDRQKDKQLKINVKRMIAELTEKRCMSIAGFEVETKEEKLT